MKGICDYKILNNGKDVTSLRTGNTKKHNVVFDIPSYMLDKWIKMRTLAPSGAARQNSYGGPTKNFIGDGPEDFQKLFKGIRLFDTALSTTDPTDVKLPVLSAGPVRSVSAPWNYAQSSFSADALKLTIGATWNIGAGGKIIKAIALCNDKVANNPINIATDSYPLYGSQYGITNLIVPLTEQASLVYRFYGTNNGNTGPVVLLCRVTKNMSQFSKTHTPVVNFTSYSEGNYTMHYVNPEKTKLYIGDNSQVLRVYDITNTTFTLEKTYTSYSPALSSCIFFNVPNGETTRDILTKVSGTTLSFYELSRVDNSVTEIAAASIQMPTSADLRPYVFNNSFGVLKNGLMFYPPDANNAVKTYYNFANEAAAMFYTPGMNFNAENLIMLQMWCSASVSEESVVRSAEVSCNSIIASKWFNTTALNFDEDIVLLEGDTFVVTYKVGMGQSVVFNSNGGSAVESQLLVASSKATEPTDPTKDGFTFDGWYSDEELTVAYDFETAVTTDITLYAKWV